jgi:lipoate-protein ligase A
MNDWLRIPLLRAPQSYHLALTEALLQTAAERPPVLYWQIAEPEAMVVGIGQKLSDVDMDACQAAGLAIYRRAAGGTAVLAGPDLLSLDVILPPGHPLAGQDIVEAYCWFGDLWAKTLQRFGLSAHLVSPAEAHAPRSRRFLAQAERQEQLVRESCYGAISPYEITIQGRKVIGLDQVRRRIGFLFQGGLLLRWDAERIASLLAALPEERPLLAEGLRARAAGIDELLGRDINTSEIIIRFEALLQEHYQADLSDMTIGPEIERQARGYEQERYAPLAAAPAEQRAASGEG